MRLMKCILIAMCLCSIIIFGCGSDEDGTQDEATTITQPEPTSVDEPDGQPGETVPNLTPQLEQQIATFVNQLNDPNAEIRRTAVLSLVKLNHPATVSGLIKALSDEDKEIRQIAADGLGKIGEPAIPALIRELKRLDNKPKDEQELLFEVFSQIGAPAVLPLINIWRTEDPRDDIHSDVSNILVGIGEPAVEPLIAALDDGVETVYQNAAETLVDIGAPGVPLLIGALDHANAQVRRLAVQVLGGIGKPAKEAVPALEKATNDPDAIVRQSAQVALREILKIRLIDSDPKEGDTIAADGILTLTFDEPVKTVTVNGKPATVQGTTARWQAEGLTPAKRTTLTVAWDGGNSTVLSFNVKKIELVRSDPPHRGQIIVNDLLTLFFDFRPKNVTINRSPVLVRDKAVTWRASGGGVRPGQWVVLQIEWEGGDGEIISLLPIDGVPKHPLPRGRIISDRAKGVNPDSVNREGIRIEFNQFVQEGKADIAFEDGTLMNWTAEWEDASVLLVVGNGIRLINEAAYIITVETRDLAGNRIGIRIRFVTG